MAYWKRFPSLRHIDDEVLEKVFVGIRAGQSLKEIEEELGGEVTADRIMDWQYLDEDYARVLKRALRDRARRKTKTPLIENNPAASRMIYGKKLPEHSVYTPELAFKICCEVQKGIALHRLIKIGYEERWFPLNTNLRSLIAYWSRNYRAFYVGYRLARKYQGISCPPGFKQRLRHVFREQIIDTGADLV